MDCDKHHAGTKERGHRVQCRNQTKASCYLIIVIPELKQQKISLKLPPTTSSKHNNEHTFSIGTGTIFSRGIQSQLGKQVILRCYHTLVLHSAGDIWISFCAAISRGPSQTSGCSFSTLQWHGAGATSKSVRLHSPRSWFWPNTENYVTFAKILMHVMLQC